MTTMDINNGCMYPKESYKFLRIPPKDDATPNNQPPNMENYIISILEDKTMKFFKNTLIRTVKGYEIGAELLFMASIAGVAKTHKPHQTEMIQNIIQIMIQQLQHDEEMELNGYSKQNTQESNITSEEADIYALF